MEERNRFDFEPWHESVDGEHLIRELRRHLNMVVVLPNHADIAIALWIAHTYLIRPSAENQAIHVSPVLSINSPDRQCGKSTLKTILSQLVARSCPTDNVSTASLFRLLQAEQPTLLIDEADTFLLGKNDMVGILNSGYRPDGFVIRQGGLNYGESIRFATWGAKAIFSIGILPPTLHSRSIHIPMKRKRTDEKVHRLENYLRMHAGDLRVLRQKILRFCQDNITSIAEANPCLPDSLDDRQQDNWEPLLQIASACGTRTLSQALDAAVVMSPINIFDSTNLAELLLEDIADFFEVEKTERVSSSSLLQFLLSDETKPWVDYRHGRNMTQSDIAVLLRRYGIRPVDMRISGRVVKGYSERDFDDVFQRYLPKERLARPATSDPPRQARDTGDTSARRVEGF
jgi:putative DNA primase/helicase